MTGFTDFVSEKESGIWTWGAGEWERAAERLSEGLGYGFERLWEKVIGLEMCDYCLLYGLDIVRDLAKVQVGYDSRSHRSHESCVTLEKNQIL